VTEAAESELSGEVSPRTSGGVIRYRSWPARRHKLMTCCALAILLGLSGAAYFAFGEWLWATFVFLGLGSAGALFIFPTEVALDGPALHIRHLASPRSVDLRTMKRMEVSGDLFQRVELGTESSLSPMDTVRGVILPLPSGTEFREQVLDHLRYFVAKPDEDSKIFGDDALLPLGE
jgi:hypothetical protein